MNEEPIENTMDLCKHLLKNDWQLHLKHDEDILMLESSHTELEEIADSAAVYMCEMFALLEQTDIQSIKEQLFDLIKQNLKQQFTSHPENWFLFDWLGKPICAVPDKKTGINFCKELEQKHNIILQCFNAFELPVSNSFKLWNWLKKSRNCYRFLQIKIMFCKIRNNFLH
ncbi:MAG: hypothetical protein IJ150_10255 [Bacteroidales bacterium]|nr:hypothetical protein [Bacteroidales bacterium]